MKIILALLITIVATTTMARASGGEQARCEVAWESYDWFSMAVHCKIAAEDAAYLAHIANDNDTKAVRLAQAALDQILGVLGERREGIDDNIDTDYAAAQHYMHTARILPVSSTTRRMIDSSKRLYDQIDARL